MGVVGNSDPVSDGLSSSGTVLLASASYDHTIHFWDLAAEVNLKTLQHPESQVNAMQFTPNRTQLATAGYNHIRMYDLLSKDVGPVVSFEGGKNFASVGFEIDGRWMYAGGEDFMVRIWDLRTSGSHCSKMFQARDPVNSVCLMPNQCELIVGDQGGTVHLWDVRNDQNEQIVPEEKCVAIQHVDVDPEGAMVAAVSNRGTLYVWSVVKGSPHVIQPQQQQFLQPEGAPTNFDVLMSQSPELSVQQRQLTPSQNHASPTGQLRIDSEVEQRKLCSPVSPLEPSKLVAKTRKPVHSMYALRCRFSPDSTLLATCSSKNTACLWGTGTNYNLIGEMSMKPPTPSDQPASNCWVWDCAFTSDSQNLITCSSDHHVRLWSCIDGQWQFAKVIGTHQKAVTALAFSDQVI